MAEESKGILDSLSNLAATLTDVLHTRLALLSMEIEEDRLRMLSLLAMSVIAAFFLIVGIVITIVLVVFILWDEHRLIALFSIASFLILLGSVIAAIVIYKIKTKPKLFSASLAELKKDKERLISR